MRIGTSQIKSYTLSTKDPIFAGITQEAEVERSWSRGMLRKVYLTPSGITAILICPWLANDQKAFESAWMYKQKYGAQTVVVGELKEK